MELLEKPQSDLGLFEIQQLRAHLVHSAHRKVPYDSQSGFTDTF